jgi:hypothetical protein
MHHDADMQALFASIYRALGLSEGFAGWTEWSRYAANGEWF